MMILERGRFLTEWVLLIAGLMLAGFVIGVAQYREYADIDRRERDRLATQAGIINKNLGRSLQVHLLLSSQRLVAGLLPLLRRSAEQDGHADAVFVTSTAAQVAYPGGAGYNAAKAAESGSTLVSPRMSAEVAAGRFCRFLETASAAMWWRAMARWAWFLGASPKLDLRWMS